MHAGTHAHVDNSPHSYLIHVFLPHPQHISATLSPEVSPAHPIATAAAAAHSARCTPPCLAFWLVWQRQRLLVKEGEEFVTGAQASGQEG